MATDVTTPINSSKFIAAVDMGTNSFKMLVVGAEANGRFLSIDRFKEAVVLGRGMDSNSNAPSLTLESQNRAISALHKFNQILRTHLEVEVDHTRFVATSAVREAINKAEFLSKIEQETCSSVEILSGEEEARLVYFGVLQFLPVYHKTVLTVDIGGGSTEFVIGKQGKVLLTVSLRLGHVVLTEAFANYNYAGAAIDNMKRHIRSVIHESGLVEKVRQLGFEIAVGSSGTIRSIEKAVFFTYDQDLLLLSPTVSPRKRRFSRKGLNCVVTKLGDLDQNGEWRNRFFKRRSEFILAGAVLLSEIFDILNIGEMEVSEYALGEGVVVDTLARCSADYDISTNARWRSVVGLATRFNNQKRMKSAMCCAGFARDFFVGLKRHIHFANHPNEFVLLDTKDVEYLEAACMLHNIGLYIGRKGYHKQSYHIIKNINYLEVYNSEEVELIALLVRHHRKKFPKADHSSLHVLPDKLKVKFRILCTIIRISVAVQKNLCMTLQGLETSNSTERVLMVLSCSKDQILPTGHHQPTVEDVEAELKLELEHFEQDRCMRNIVCQRPLVPVDSEIERTIRHILKKQNKIS